MRRRAILLGASAVCVAEVAIASAATPDMELPRTYGDISEVGPPFVALPAFDEASAVLLSQDIRTQVWRDASGMTRTEYAFSPQYERHGAVMFGIMYGVDYMVRTLIFHDDDAYYNNHLERDAREHENP